MKQTVTRHNFDGLNNLKYEIISDDYFPLYRRLIVDFENMDDSEVSMAESAHKYNWLNDVLEFSVLKHLNPNKYKLLKNSSDPVKKHPIRMRKMYQMRRNKTALNKTLRDKKSEKLKLRAEQNMRRMNETVQKHLMKIRNLTLPRTIKKNVTELKIVESNQTAPTVVHELSKRAPTLNQTMIENQKIENIEKTNNITQILPTRQTDVVLQNVTKKTF